MIRIRGARQHNLKNVDVTFPREAISVITGPSGSGKSSLAFDTLYAESQRRYVESLGTHTRQHLELLAKPEVDAIEGLSPAIAVRQEAPPKNPRSTVGTVTEIHDFLRVLYARIGQPHCHLCGRAVRGYSVQQMVDVAQARPGVKLVVRAPIVMGLASNLEAELGQLRRDGFVRAVLDEETVDLGETLRIDAKKTHSLDAVIDRLVLKADIRTRLTDSIELALRTSPRRLARLAFEGEAPLLLSERAMCLHCDIVLPELSTRSFSWNAPEGACATCDGLGDIPIEAPTPEAKAAKRGKQKAIFDEDELAEATPHRAKCPTCLGARLRAESRAVKVLDRNITSISALSVDDLRAFLGSHVEDALSPGTLEVARPLLREITTRLAFLDEVGVGYLSLDRSASTLSSGEAQRIRLGTRLGGALVGVLYVLDEPSVGLHPRDTDRLIATLERLRAQGNTVVVVEHDLDLIRAASHVVDVGPHAGRLGGEILFQGTPDELAKSEKSVTAPWLHGRALARSTPKPEQSKTELFLHNVHMHNVKGTSLAIPLQRLVAITGVSGSGKSTLLMHALLPALKAHLARNAPPFRIDGAENIARVVAVDQTPIGRTPRSTPATYVGLMTPLRELFATLPEARARGYDASRFSSNVKGGRCEACEGEGLLRVEMQLLPDVYVRCETCQGTRFNRDTLEVQYRGLSVAQVLALPIEEAADIFDAIPPLRDKLRILRELGLGYLTLGQSATTLSGGEAQRLKLAKELARKSDLRTLYVLDEPTTGLHLGDVEALLDVFDRLVAEGHTVVFIEHAMELVACADWVIDVGPEGGAGGGQVIAEGTPHDVSKTKTHTGAALSRLEGRARLVGTAKPRPARSKKLIER